MRGISGAFGPVLRESCSSIAHSFLEEPLRASVIEGQTLARIRHYYLRSVDTRTATIPQYQVHKTKKHTLNLPLRATVH